MVFCDQFVGEETGENGIETPPIEIYVLPNPEGIIQPPHQAGSIREEVYASPEPEAKPKRPRKKF